MDERCGDSENNFDELRNQWRWAGFTTRDRKRCQVMERITTLIYNWWTIFVGQLYLNLLSRDGF